MKKITITALALFLSDAAFACTPLRSDAEYVNILNAQRSLIVVSQNQNFFLKLIPSKWAWEKGRMVKKRDSYALAFEALPYGQQKQLWSYKHWDANAKRPNLYLSSDGMNLVEVNANVSSLQDTRAVVTYRKGQKFQTYPPSTFGVTKLKPKPCRNKTWLNDLVKNDRAIQAVNGSRWVISPETLTIKPVK